MLFLLLLMSVIDDICNNSNINNINNININITILTIYILISILTITIVLGGKAEPSAEDVTSLITSAGGEVDEEQLGVLLADVAGKNLNELLAKGEEDLKSVSVGGGGAAPAAAAGGAAAPAPGKHYCRKFLLLLLWTNLIILAAAPAKPKEEEVDALDGGMDMFGGNFNHYHKNSSSS